MSVVTGRRLFVEGELDASLIRKLIAEVEMDFLVQDEGSKDGLKSKVIDAREKARKKGSRSHVFYLRDRDYDFDVPAGMTVAQEITDHTHGVIGWHWCRHEVENYLLEPSVLHAYLSQGNQALSYQEVEEKLIAAALFIRDYQVARRTLGVSKRRTMLPAPYDLGTRPSELRKKEIALPSKMALDDCLGWVLESAKGFREQVTTTLDEEEIRLRFEDFNQKLNSEKCRDIAWVLHMFSGKDLFAALDPWFKEVGLQGAKDARNKLGEFLTEEPQFALEVLPEWKSFMDMLKQIE